MAAYFDDNDLARFGEMGDHAKEHWQRFMAYYGRAFEPGLLTKREKLLVGFAVSHSEKCPYCIDSYVQQCLAAGLTMEHLSEALHCVASLRAGITMAHGLVTKKVDDKLGM